MKKRAKINKKILVLAIVLAVVGGLAINQALNQNPSDNQASLQPATETEPIKQEAVAVDPCVLLDLEDIQRIYQSEFQIGLAKELEPSSDNQPVSECEYRQVNDGSVESLANAYSLKVLIENYSSSEIAKLKLDELKREAEAGRVPYEILSIEGFENETFFYSPTASDLEKTQETLMAIKGPQIFSLTLFKQNGIDRQAEQARLKDLAQTKF